MGRKSFYILSFGFTFSTLNFKFSSTLVVSALQIHLFMQNKANSRNSQMNVSCIITKDYEDKTLGECGKKQSQTNPNKAKFKKAKMNATSIITKGYVNKLPIPAQKKQSQTSKRQKPMQIFMSKRIMKINHPARLEKTNPNKPNPPTPNKRSKTLVWPPERMNQKKLNIFTKNPCKSRTNNTKCIKSISTIIPIHIQKVL